jgi:hypothetical protein
VLSTFFFFFSLLDTSSSLSSLLLPNPHYDFALERRKATFSGDDARWLVLREGV